MLGRKKIKKVLILGNSLVEVARIMDQGPGIEFRIETVANNLETTINRNRGLQGVILLPRIKQDQGGEDYIRIDSCRIEDRVSICCQKKSIKFKFLADGVEGNEEIIKDWLQEL